jgi:transposase
MSYSLDLRERVVTYVESGSSRASAARLFNVGERTVRRWLDLKKETGDLLPRPHGGGYPPKIDLSELKKFVDSNPNQTLLDLEKEFSASGASLWQALKKLDYTYKKNPSLPGKGCWQKS